MSKKSKASTGQIVACLMAYLKDKKYPYEPGSFLIASPNYKYRRVRMAVTVLLFCIMFQACQQTPTADTPIWSTNDLIKKLKTQRDQDSVLYELEVRTISVIYETKMDSIKLKTIDDYLKK